MYFSCNVVLVEWCLGVQTITWPLLAESLYLSKGLFWFVSSWHLLIQCSAEKCWHQGQWNTSCLEILCMFCCKTIPVYRFQLLNFQRFTVASGYFRVLFSISWIENKRKVCVMLLGQDYCVHCLNGPLVTLFPYVMHVVVFNALTNKALSGS